MLVQPQQAATVCELDLVQHAIRSWKRAQTLDPKQRPENCPWTPNLTLDCKHAHVSQFTSDDFTGTLERHGVTISMDGKGRYMARSNGTLRIYA